MKKEELSSRKAVAVFDVGKTNKKLLIYDSNLTLLESSSEQFDAVESGDVFVETTDETFAWLQGALSKATGKHDIGCISIAAHGAACACLDESGGPVFPVLSYTTDPGDEFHQEFYREFADPRALQRLTFTPDMPGLGSLAKVLYYIKTRHPDKFGDIRTILPLPQYYSYLMTGVAGVENTYLANHTYLWDFEKNDWSDVARGLGVAGLFPAPVKRPWDVLGTISPEFAKKTGLASDVIVSLGIHDSNASLLPYLITTRDDFVLNSTGSVCVAMHPTDRVGLADDELGKMVFYNQNAYGNPVKIAFFLGGMEFDAYMGLITQAAGQKDFPGIDEAQVEKVLADRSLFILPSMVSIGMFPESPARVVEGDRVYPFGNLFTGEVPEFFSDFNTAYTVLSVGLALQTKAALDRVGLRDGMPLFVEGGFRSNEVYTAVLSALYPASNLSLTNMEEATAFGTALVGKAALEGVDPKALTNLFQIEKREITARKLPGLEGYANAFFGMVDA